MSYLIWLILVLVALFLIKKFLSQFKFPKVACLACFTGALGAGKSSVSLAVAKSKYKAVHRSWAIRSFFRKNFRLELDEEPLFYSNIPLANIPYCELTMNHILKKTRFNFGSVVWIDEVSLMADCYLSFDDKTANVVLMSFWKLFRQETHNGYCIINSQTMTDIHKSIRKCCNQYFYLHDVCSSFFIPFVSWCHMREERYSEDGSVVNSYDADVEDSMKTCIFRKPFKNYDSWAYSSLTDDLPVENIKHRLTKFDSLKAKNIVSFRKEFANLFSDLEEKKRKEKNMEENVNVEK